MMTNVHLTPAEKMTIAANETAARLEANQAYRAACRAARVTPANPYNFSVPALYAKIAKLQAAQAQRGAFVTALTA